MPNRTSRTPSQKAFDGWTPIPRAPWQCRAFTRGLTWDEKMLLFQITTDESSAAGVTRIGADLMAARHPDRTPAQISTYLGGLETAGFIVRSGTETFVRSWFRDHVPPARLTTGPNLAPYVSAIRAVVHDDLAAVVATALFSRLVEISVVDEKSIASGVRAVCCDLARDLACPVPDALRV